MDRKEQILKIVERKGFVRAGDLMDEGISRTYLYTLYKEGKLEKVARGLYTHLSDSGTEHTTLVEVAKRYPKAVICLVSALSFYNLTIQIPHEIWIALPKGAWRPNDNYPPLNVTFLSGENYSFGIQENEIQGVKVKIYNRAKTVADCFKFRNKVGLDVAIEVLKEVWRSQTVSMDDLMQAAKICRVDKIMRPYLEAIV